jgi:cell division protein FtsL
MFYSIISGANEGGNFLKTKRRGGNSEIRKRKAFKPLIIITIIMKKSLIIILSVVVVIVILGLILLPQKLVTTSNCDLKASESEKNVCLVDNAVKSKDLTQCDKISDLAYKSDCLSKVSAALKNCDELQVMEKAICYQVRATNEKDTKLCDKIRDSSWAGSESVVYSCYTDVAKTTKDVSVCQKLRDIEQNGPYKNNKYSNICYSLVAEELMQPNLCANLIVVTETDQKNKDYCIKVSS